MIMVQMILQKSPYIDPNFTNETRINAFTILLNFADRQIEKGEWTSEEVFNIFDSDLHTDIYFSMCRGILTSFWQHLNKSSIYKKPSKDLAYEIRLFPLYYTCERMQHISLLARYLMPLNVDNRELENLYECLRDCNRSYKENISDFLDRYVELIPNLSLTSEDWLEKYEELSDIITQHLKDQRVSEYPEVKNGIELMQDSVEEFRSLDEFISWVFDSTDDSNVAYLECGLDDIEKAIKYFESALSQDIDRDIETKFHNFFISLKDTQGIEVSEQQINRLHEIVTKYYEQTGRVGTIYRRILIKLSSNKDQFNDSEKQ